MFKEFAQDALHRFVSTRALGAFTVSVVNQLLGFAVFILLARMLGVQEFGLYVVAWSWVRILLHIAKFGFDMAATKFWPAYTEKEDWPRLRSFFRTGIKAMLISNIIIVVLGSIIVLALTVLNGFKAPMVFILAFATLPVWSALLYLQSILRAMKKVISGLVSESLLRPLVQIGLLLALPVIGLKTGAVEAMGVTLTAFVCALIVSIIMTRRAWPIPASAPDDYNGAERRDWISTGLVFVLIAGGSVVMKQADTVMIGAMIDVKDAGFYGATTRIAMLSTFVLTAFNMVIGPMISGMYHKGEIDKLKALLKLTAAMIFLGTAVIVALLLIFSPYIFALFGPDFIAGKQALQILLVAQAINALSGPAGFVMSMTGHHLQAAKIFGLAIVLNVILNAILIPIMGINGAAIATAVTTVLWNVLLVMYTRKHLKLNTTILPMKST